MMKKLLMIGLCLAFLGASTFASAAEVYVTKSGTKYHKADCSLIKNRDVTAMDEDEAIASDYEPCRRCFKDKYGESESKDEAKIAKKSSRESKSSKSKKSSKKQK